MTDETLLLDETPLLDGMGMSPELAAELAKSSWHIADEAEGPLTCVVCGYVIDDPLYVIKEGKTYHAVLCRQAFDARHARARSTS